MQRNYILRLLTYVWPYWYLLPIVFVSMVVATMLGLAPTWLTGVVLIDRVILAREVSLLPWVALGLLAAVIFRQIFDFVQRYFLVLLTQRTIHRLRCDLYEHIQSLPLGYFSHNPVGDLVARQVNDADALEDGLQELVKEAGVHVVMICGILGLLFSLNAQLTLLVIPFVLLLWVVMHVFRRLVQRFSLRVRNRLGQLATLATETLSGIGVVKAFSMERAELNRFRERSSTILHANVRLAQLEGIYSSVVELVLIGSTVLVVWLATPQVITETMTVGALVAYLGYLARFQNPVKGISRAYFRIQKAMGATHRIFAVLDTPSEHPVQTSDAQLPQLKGGIRFDQVTFGYRPEQPVLKDFSLAVNPGEAVALVGHSGVGKTTLVSLLLRFYPIDAGHIYVDDFPIDQVNASALRRQIALVHQEPFLFSTTVRENILYGNPAASPAEVEAAAQAANIHEFILTLPQGYDTLVGQRGMTLSGGQRQRIALARAFLKDAPILLLDEATTSVDSESEALIQAALEHLISSRTTIIIAHRLASLQNADRVVVMEDGAVIEEGTHQDLLAQDGRYRRLYEMQSLEQAALRSGS